jgi:hypothetical protein
MEFLWNSYGNPMEILWSNTVAPPHRPQTTPAPAPDRPRATPVTRQRVAPSPRAGEHNRIDWGAQGASVQSHR